MASFAVLKDPAVPHDAQELVKGNILVKFCSLGFVTSHKWVPCYVTIYNGVLSLYKNEAEALASPRTPITKIPLDSMHRASAWSREKCCFEGPSLEDFFCFYVVEDHSYFLHTRDLKLGSKDLDFTEKLMRSIELNTHHRVGEA